MPTLKQFRYLVAVADTLHFRRAAEQCHVTQPTLSAQLRELEERLSVQLVERSRSGVVMTPVGDRIVSLARLVLKDVDSIVEIAKHGKYLFTDTLRLGILHSLGPYLLPQILPEIHETYPELKLYIREAFPQELLNSLEEGKLDLLLFPLPVQEADLACEPVFREPLLLAAPSDHKVKDKPVVERTDLNGETVLALEPGHRLHEQVRNLCNQYGATLSHEYEGTSLDTLRQMVAMGMGLSFLPALYVRQEMQADEQVITRPIAGAQPSRTIGIVWRKRSSRNGEFSELAALIRNVVRAKVPEITVLD